MYIIQTGNSAGTAEVLSHPVAILSSSGPFLRALRHPLSHPWRRNNMGMKQSSATHRREKKARKVGTVPQRGDVSGSD